MLSLADYAARAAKAFIAALVAIIRAIFGGAKEAALSLAGDARRVGRAAKAVGEATGRAVGKGLDGPARVLDLTADAIGSTLGALLPRPPVGPRDVADAAVAADRVPVSARPPQASGPVPLVGVAVQLAAASLLHGGDAEVARRELADAPQHVRDWFGRLTPSDLQRLTTLPSRTVHRHVTATDASDRIADLPPVGAAPGAMSDAEQRAALAAARRRMAGERAEVEAMGRRGGVRSLADEGYVPAQTWTTAPRPSMH
ncbi:hypothetical protein [Methylobacterium planeticum]|uniref:Uncharacterized protein n=1 Tax=Methylobacterium planeticum TaxID=2615211 RepID=A0A6N6MKK9_9HYPH|nr:hypothetical protein [Methylobacterium planeticum]KAB1071159.1 hypothetical protein F6X51_19865 [Methylobacterium planeticum]